MENFSDFVTHYGWFALIFVGMLLVVFAKKISKAFGGEAVEIKAEQVVELVEQQQALLIDLAEKTTFEKGHVPNAINMPGITFIDGSVTPLEDTSKPVILIPMKGLIPMPVIEFLNAAGVAEVYIFKGGLKEWQKAGLSL